MNKKGGSMTLTIEVRSKPGKISELYQTLQALLPTMRQEKGCLNCRVSQDMEDDEVYVLSSDWDGQASFEGYAKSTSGSALLGAIKTLGRRQESSWAVTLNGRVSRHCCR